MIRVVMRMFLDGKGVGVASQQVLRTGMIFPMIFWILGVRVVRVVRVVGVVVEVARKVTEMYKAIPYLFVLDYEAFYLSF